jgi:hypothetical protein
MTASTSDLTDTLHNHITALLFPLQGTAGQIYTEKHHMETELTSKLKKLTHGFKPKMPTRMRTIRWADEVWTPTGIVDSIRFEDYDAGFEIICPYIHPDHFNENALQTMFAPQHPIGVCFRDNQTTADTQKCKGCVFAHRNHIIKMMCTCYEAKITFSDFKSQNGHNFHGNENYYVVPVELAEKIKPLIPDDIGILAYKETEKTAGLRTYKPSGWREVPDDIMVQLLYNAMKKWCDGAVFV